MISSYRYHVFLFGLIAIGLLMSLFFRFRQNRSLCVKCNIVLVDIDVLRADSLECFGYRKIVAPNLCRFAQQGFRFQRNISQSNWTFTSMVSTITSLYPSAHKVREAKRDKLNPGILTLAKLLKSAGYRTTYMSSFNEANPYILNVENGTLRGYDHVAYGQNIGTWLPAIENLEKSRQPFFLHLYVNNLHMPYLIPEGAQPLEILEKPKGFPLTAKEYDETLEDYLAEHYQEVFTDTAIQKHPELFINTKRTKKEIREYYWSFGNTFNLKGLKVVWDPVEKSYTKHVDVKNPEHRAYVRMLYHTLINTLDAKLALFFDHLAISPSAVNTIVIIMSDHGEAFGERGIFNKDNSLYNEAIHTPLIFRIPGTQGKDIDTVTQNIDIFPTIIEAIGGRITQQLQGMSILPLINGNNSSKRVAVGETATWISIQDSRWKLIADKSGKPVSFELYDLTSDSGETNNLAGLKPQIADLYYNQLRGILDHAEKQNRDLLPSFIDPQKRRRVLEEGYF